MPANKQLGGRFAVFIRRLRESLSIVNTLAALRQRAP